MSVVESNNPVISRALHFLPLLHMKVLISVYLSLDVAFPYINTLQPRKVLEHPDPEISQLGGYDASYFIIMYELNKINFWRGCLERESLSYKLKSILELLKSELRLVKWFITISRLKISYRKRNQAIKLTIRIFTRKICSIYFSLYILNHYIQIQRKVDFHYSAFNGNSKQKGSNSQIKKKD